MNCFIASTSFFVLFDGIRYPLIPFSTVSLHPGISVVIMGRPMAQASINERLSPSPYLLIEETDGFKDRFEEMKHLVDTKEKG